MEGIGCETVPGRFKQTITRDHLAATQSNLDFYLGHSLDPCGAAGLNPPIFLLTACGA